MKRPGILSTLSSRKQQAVILVNLGSPDAPTAAALKRYLCQFLHDPRVIEVPRAIWCPILHGIILRTRPRKVAKSYADIWLPDGSPLVAYSRRLARKLQQHVNSTYDNPPRVSVAMRYGQPDLLDQLAQLQADGIEEILLLPMFPQYSAATTATIFDRAARYCRQQRNIPAVSFVHDYHDFPAYIQAIAHSVTRHWASHSKGDKLLISFHGLPQRNVKLGDPYYDQCQRTARLIADALGLRDDAWQLVFQSRFGRQVWLQPYCEDTLINLAQQGCDHVDVICPGFAVDCLETLEEIQLRYRDSFIAAGGKGFQYIPALNDSDSQVALYQQLIAQHLGARLGLKATSAVVAEPA